MSYPKTIINETIYYNKIKNILYIVDEYLFLFNNFFCHGITIKKIRLKFPSHNYFQQL